MENEKAHERARAVPAAPKRENYYKEECVPNPLFEARGRNTMGQGGQGNPIAQKDEVQNSRSSGGRSQRESVHERLGDRVHSNNLRISSEAAQYFDLRTHIYQSRSKMHARKEKSKNSSIGDSNSECFPKTSGKGPSKQKTLIPGNMIGINDLAKAIKKLEYESKTDKDLLEGSDSPFTKEILTHSFW